MFGRIKKVINPNDTTSTYGTMSYDYLGFGTVGSQRVVAYATEQSGTGNYIWSETYFDGLGRTIKTRAEGPDSKIIATQTIYNNRGLVEYTSLSYFQGTETPRWTTYEYDPIGRVKKVTNPDTTFATKDYLKGTITYIDANGHKKVEVKDIYGRLIEVEEYFGVSPSFSLYAATTYEYDVLGNLTKVIDAQNNQTVITYDSLSRKVSMDDPDMGHWEYDYDANGNLEYQKDAKLQGIYFRYDALNRIRQKDYQTQKPLGSGDIVYTYDESFSTNYKGRLTTQIDSSGATKFFYDKLGQTIKTIKNIDGTDHTTETTYDALGRIATITYPDTTVIKYKYDSGGNIYQVTDLSGATVYAEYTGYNAMGQAASIGYGNGVSTGYTYDALNNRLRTINTTSPTAVTLINLRYDQYDNVGNIKKIIDYLNYPDNKSRTRDFIYDDLDRLIEADSESYGGNLIYQYDKIGNMTYNCKYGYYYYDDNNHKHAVTRVVKNGVTTDYAYDNNGNMTSGDGRTLTYDYDNKPTSITYNSAATVSVYDASGQRVKKQTPIATTIYIGDIYECASGQCTKYIFAGSQRIAEIQNTNTYYYHTDHLGSSSVVTDSAGNSAQQLYYYPYGEIKGNTGSDIAKHKFIDQEWDAETGLYYYGARYYDPALARFISADTIVPNPWDPQDLNRYTYAGNNPLIYIDPTGHFKLGTFLKAVVSGIIGGAVFVLSGGTAPILAGIMAGMAAGATSAALNGGNVGQILQGAVMGGVLGGIGGGLYSAFGATGAYAMLGAGAGYSTATGGLDGLAYYAGGIAGGIAGAYGAQYAMDNWFAGEVGDGIGSTNSDARNTRMIKNNIDGVEIDYKRGAENPVDSVLADRFESAVGLTKNEYPGLNKLTISATTNAHRPPSLHVNGFAIDIARVNGIRIGSGYGGNPFVTSVVRSLQTNLGGAYENYGPAMMIGPRAASDYLIRSHQDHIHYSIKP